MKKILLPILFIALFIASDSDAQEYTFNEDIAEILFNNCTTCHRNGEIGPFPITSFEEVKPWATMIDYVTSIKYMPPWSPDADYSEFIGERVLNDEELLAIKTWVMDGAPEGPSVPPGLPEFPAGSQLGTPDLVLSFDESYLHQGNNTDEYRVFVLPTGLTEDRIIKAVEMRPGNNKIVHHALISYDNTGTAQRLDNETPEYGYQSFGGFGDGLLMSFALQFPGYVPGQKPALFPLGIGQTLPANADIIVQVHYAPIASSQRDSSSINIFFADENEEIDRIAQNLFMTPFTSTGDPGRQLLNIQANEIEKYHYTSIVPNKTSVFAVTPHMHLLGKSWKVYAISSVGDTTNLIKIPDWDFNWQGSFNYDKFQILEAGTVVHAYATYDNTTDNPLNPNNPPQNVSWGELTTDEMFYLPITYVNYQEGDENTDLTITAVDDLKPIKKLNHLYPIYPNPVSEQINIKWKINKAQKIKAQILNVEGRLMETCIQDNYLSGEHEYIHDVKSLKSGSYLIKVQGEYFEQSQLFQKF